MIVLLNAHAAYAMAFFNASIICSARASPTLTSTRPMSEGAAKGIAYCLNILPFTSGFGTIITACAGHVTGGNSIRCKIITMGIF